MTVQAIQPVVQTQPAKKGGSRIGGLLGLIGGGLAAVATGGLSIPATIGAVAGGASLGQNVGGLIDPAQAAEESRTQGVATDPDEGPMTRRLKSGEAQAKLAQLRDSAMATAELPPDQRQQYLDPIMKAAGTLKQQMGA